MTLGVGVVVVVVVVLVGFGEVGVGELGGSAGNPDIVQPELNGVGSAETLVRTMV